MRNLIVTINLLLAVMTLSAGVITNSGKAEKAGWLLGAQSYTFYRSTFVETLDKMQKLGLKNVEVYFGQNLGDGFSGTMDYKIDKITRRKLVKLAKSKGIKIIACGVVICKNNTEWDQLFEFAKSMGIKIITSEPALDQLDYVEKLADKYNIDVAIHNHPKPSTYWNVDDLLNALKGRSQHLGSCADLGHWNRMGIDPLEAIKKCEGRLKSFHFKDVAEAGADAHDTILGSGVCKVDAILKELKRQNFKGLFSIEYESQKENPESDVKQCISYFNTSVDKLF